MNFSKLSESYIKYKVKGFEDRYFPSKSLEEIMNMCKLKPNIIGQSVLGKNIYSIEQGKGNINVILWAQMHGNETTATKAIFDLINFLNSEDELSKLINDNLKIHYIPQLNPDGADYYKRRNALNIDINRDFNAEQTPEIKVLKAYINNKKPKYLFNLHDQRTIFNVENTKKPATISLLAPSVDNLNSYPNNRSDAAKIIYKIYLDLQLLTNKQISIFSNEFYPNATGDNFQKLGYKTILLECGHYIDDYNRVIVRKMAYLSILSALKSISKQNYKKYTIAEYESISNNNSNAYDILFTNVKYTKSGKVFNFSIALQYEEVLENNTIKFKAKVADIGDLSNHFGYKQVDASLFNFNLSKIPEIGEYINIRESNLYNLLNMD